ncbi:MAG: histidine phosphatase family protein [Candidatus Baltobacteraceae bacterium]
MSVQLTLIRHGPTEWNATRRFQGRSDVPLSVRGRAHAQAIAAALAADPIDRIYSSDLSRALETARILSAARGIEVESDPRLREFDFGKWEGLTWDEIVTAYPHLTGLGSTAAKRYAPEGGESFEEVRERLRSFLDEIVRADPAANVAVVTHAGPLHAIVSILQLAEADSPPDRLSLNFTPGGISRIAMEEGRARIITLNDTGHLNTAG